MLSNFKKQVNSRYQTFIIRANQYYPANSILKKIILIEKMCLLILSSVLLTYCKKKFILVPYWLTLILFVYYL